MLNRDIDGRGPHCRVLQRQSPPWKLCVKNLFLVLKKGCFTKASYGLKRVPETAALYMYVGLCRKHVDDDDEKARLDVIATSL